LAGISPDLLQSASIKKKNLLGERRRGNWGVNLNFNLELGGGKVSETYKIHDVETKMCPQIHIRVVEMDDEEL
jgi:hypothetical protein